MKSLILTASFLTLVLTSCAASSGNADVARVGPAPTKPADLTKGTLTVYSAFESTPPSPSQFDDIKHYSDYRVQTKDGTILQSVHNRSLGLGDRPLNVELPAGTFQVVAKANGHGVVTIPVVIEPNKTTTVHLEGGRKAGPSGAKPEELVTLPDGQVIGWRASTVATAP